MHEEVFRSGRHDALEEVTMLLDLAIARSRASHLLDGRTKELVRGYLETAKQELGRLTEPYGAANGDTHEEAHDVEQVVRWR